MDTIVAQKTRIDIPYHPFHFETKGHTIEKAVEGSTVKHRYLRGITSGTKVDGHGERITESCIKDLQEQGKAGTVLLYADRHNVSYTEDIGILVDSEVTPDGDWVCEFRLYDESDGVSQSCLDTIEKLWKQINGLPPYKAPLQKGFSIEGYVPDNGILSVDADGRRVINRIILDGAVVVPRPAYTSSVASSLYKALDENPPWVDAKIEQGASAFKTAIAAGEMQNSYFKSSYKYQDKLEELIGQIMSGAGIRNKKSALEKVFKEYSSAMIELILSSQGAFENHGSSLDEEDFRYLYTPSMGSKIQVLKSLSSKVDELINTIHKTEV